MSKIFTWKHGEVRVSLSAGEVMLSTPEGGLAPDTSFDGLIPLAVWREISEWLDTAE